MSNRRKRKKQRKAKAKLVTSELRHVPAEPAGAAAADALMSIFGMQRVAG